MQELLHKKYCKTVSKHRVKILRPLLESWDVPDYVLGKKILRARTRGAEISVENFHSVKKLENLCLFQGSRQPNNRVWQQNQCLERKVSVLQKSFALEFIQIDTKINSKLFDINSAKNVVFPEFSSNVGKAVFLLRKCPSTLLLMLLCQEKTHIESWF